MLESIIRFSLERRRLVIVLVLAIGALGIWNFNRLSIDAVPDITNVQVVVNTEAPGFTPLEIEQRITFVLENNMTGMKGLKYTRSLSRYGLSQITLIFEDGTDIYFARQQVSERLLSAADDLPSDLTPKLGPVATGLGEIFMFTVDAEPGATNEKGEEYSSTDLRSIHDWIVRPQLLRVSGVVEVNPIGGYKREILIALDPAKMLARQVTQQQIVTALERSNQNRGAGYIEQSGAQWLIRVPGQAKTLQDIENIFLLEAEGIPIRVKDVANVQEGLELRSGAASQNGREVVLSTVFMLMGENSREVASAVGKKIADITSSLPEGVTLTPVYDRTTLVNKTLNTVQKNLLEGALLVIVVLFLLLGNLRAALITAAVIPICMLMTITGMVQSRVSANLMSLGALDFGLIVDGAVIIVENCLRRLSGAQRNATLTLNERLSLVFEATREVIRPALFGVFIITAVYLPIFALTGVEGKMFHPMALTVIIALVSAIILSITFVPAAVAFLVTKPITERKNPVIERSQNFYQSLLNSILKFRLWIVISALGLVLISGISATRLGSEFIPNLDEGDIAMHALRIPGTSLTQALQLQEQLEAKIKTLPEVERVFAKIGTAEVATDPMPPSVADNFIMLKPRDQWPDPSKTKADVVAELEALVTQLPGNRYEFLQPIQMRFNELLAGVRAELAIKVFGDDFDELIKAGEAIEHLVADIPGAADVSLEQATGLPVLTLKPNLEKMSRYGVTLEHLQNTVATAFGGQVAAQFYEGDRRSDIVVRLPESLRSDRDAMGNLPVSIADNDYVPLRELVTFENSTGYNQIYRENGKRRMVITANVRGTDLGTFVEAVRQSINEKIELPSGYWIEYGGTYQQLQSASERLSWVVPLTLVLILTLLVMALGSWKDALIIFTGVPLALTGGLFALLLRDIPFSISAAVGFIALSGIAVLNGLVMVSFIRDLRLQNTLLDTAIIQGAVTRLRPVLTTALVAGLGFVPMAINTGIGSEVQRPLATVVIGGIISSTLLTLVVLPALYKLLHQDLVNRY
ncbi:MAG: CusA/CzcA family heavy metal efflux RND transporter [Cellvibrio sp.]|nr:CusA/CzcA family heavy metal efflux RND transporter [Cellvibrio sp.]